MLSSLLVSYFIQQFAAPALPPQRRDETRGYIQSVQPRTHITVDAQSVGGGSISPGAQRIEMLRLRITVDCSGNADVSSIRLQRKGLGFNTDIDAVYAVHRGSRISRARSVANRDGTVDLNVRGFTIPACETEDVIILADVSATASAASQHRFELLGLDAGGSTVRINQRSGDFTRARSTIGPAVGQVSVSYLSQTQRVRFGVRQQLRRIQLSVDNVDDQLLQSITFTNNGSARNSDLQNLFLDFRNRAVTNIVSSLSDDSVTLQFNPPFLLQENAALTFTLRGDVRASRSRTLQFVIEEESDITAVPYRGR